MALENGSVHSDFHQNGEQKVVEMLGGGLANSDHHPTTSNDRSEDSHSQQVDIMEDMIADDAAWKKIQQNTFTRWANEHLKKIHQNITNLETDLEDGLRLIGLLQVLSGKVLPKHNKRPSFRSQKLENVSVALNFLEKDEQIKIVNIDSSDIVDCKLKLILGLIWHLILHYSISMSVWEGDEPEKQGNDKDKGPTPKQRLLNWVQNKVPELGISNFTSDWKDGKAIGALVDSVAPGLCPDWQDWNTKEGLQNASEAMTLADDWLNVRQLIKPEEIVNPNMDELSMMTYLSQYPSAKVNPGAPLRARTDPNRVRCYGPGLERSGCSVGTPVKFTIETFSAGKGVLQVFLTDAAGKREFIEPEFNNDRNLTYTCRYTPKMEGAHTVTVLYGHQGHMLHVPRSPFPINVEPPTGNPSLVEVFGEGIRANGVVTRKQTYFDVSTEHAGKGVLDVVVLDPKGGKDTVPVKLRQISANVWRCEYTSEVVGLHSVNVFFNREHVPDSPFPVNISPISDPKKVRVSGRGIRPNGIRVGDKTATFQIHTEFAGEGIPEAKLIEPGGSTIPIHLKKVDATTYEGNYIPTKVGRHVALITFGGQEVLNLATGEQFQIQVAPKRDTGVRAYGPGLKGGVANHPAKFIVETNGESGALGFQIEGPSQSVINCDDNGDMSCQVSYLPLAPGDYYVHILEQEEDILESPFHVRIQPEVKLLHPELVECSGHGLEGDHLMVNEPAEFVVDPRRAGSAPITAHVIDAKGNSVKCDIKEKPDGTLQGKYIPLLPGKHAIFVNYGGVATKKSPYRLDALSPANPKQVRISGPGVEKGNLSTRPTHFKVDTRGAGHVAPGSVLTSICDDAGKPIPYQSIDNLDGTLDVNYTPPFPGKYQIRVLLDDKEVAQSPFNITAEPHLDLSKVNVEGLEPIVTITRRQEFTIYWQGMRRPLDILPLRLMTPSGREVNLEKLTRRGSLSISPSTTYSYTPFELGEYLLYGISQNPFRILSTPPAEPGRVRVHGNGLRGGIQCVPAQFTIDTREAGHGPLGISVIGPEEVPIHCLDNYDGTCLCTFLPYCAGEYTIQVTFDERSVPGSPFRSVIRTRSKLDSSNLTKNVTRPSPNGKPFGADIFLDSVTEFQVEGIPDKDKLACHILSPSGQLFDTVMADTGRDSLAVAFTPGEEGKHEIELTCDGLKVPGFPYKVNVTRGSDPSKVKAKGKGLEQAIVHEPNFFQIETKGAGTGGLGLAIEGPSEAQMTCKDNRDGSCTVEYVPAMVGMYDIGIKFADKDIPGSPFKVPVLHPNTEQKVKAYGDGLNPSKVREGISQTFLIDASEAGPAEMSCKIKGLKEPPVVKDRGDGTFEVTYLPPLGSAGDDLICNLKYNGKDIVNTPVELKVRPSVEPNEVKLEGDGISPKGVPASLPTSFTIDTVDAGTGELAVEVIGPDARQRKIDLADNGNGKFRANYVPDETGNYKVDVKYGGLPVRAPITVKAHPTGHAEKCRITEGREERVEVGLENCITVDCREGGEGAVTCQIFSADGKNDIDVEVEENSDDKSYSIYYKVKESGDYVMDLKYGGSPIHGGSYGFKADSSVSETYSEERSSSFQTVRTTRASTTRTSEYRQVELTQIPIPSIAGVVTAEIKMPTGQIDKPVVEDHKNGFITVTYDPKTAGIHELHLKQNQQDIPGSPFFFYVDSVNSDALTAYGPGLSHGICGEPCNFTVSHKGSKAGGLQFSIEGTSKADIKCTDNKDGTVGVQYIATAPGEYKITAKFGDKHIRGSPFTAKITGEGRKRNQISVGSFSEVAFPGKVAAETDLRTLNAFIHAPSGLEEPCILKRLPNGNIGVSFTPREAGEHEVSIRQSGRHVGGSPFKVNVELKEVGDARKVVVTGSGLTSGKTHVENTFNVNTANAGYGGLSLSIEGPSKCEIKYADKPDNSLDICYIPTEPGYYTINLKYADHNVIQTVVKVTGEGSNRHRERIQHQGLAVPVAEVGSNCRLTFKMPGVTTFDLSAAVTSPSGVTEAAAIAEVEDGYGVQFVPKELGVHTVSVKLHDIHIPGSPFSFTVGKLKDAGAHRVHAGGRGLERGEQGVPAEFNVWTREAGPGLLALSVEGPSKAAIDLKDRNDGSCYVKYVVTEPGEYRVGIRFDDEAIPGSPFLVYISPDSGDAKKVEIGQFPGQVMMNKPAMFMVKKNGAKGQLDAKLVSPSGIQDDCFIDTVDYDSYSVRFMPKENGINHIHLKINGIHIPGSPAPVKVGEDDADPACVRAHGKGLEEVKSGEKTEFFIDTSNAGAGHLSVTIDGPSKVSMDCSELEDGYKVHWTPLATGFYFVSVKLNSCNIPGSPFKVPCTGKEVAEKGMTESSTVVVETSHKISKNQAQVKPALPTFKSNASKVTSKGMGLKKAYIQKQNQFTVNASDAGNNILYVGMLGPKGPCEELFIKHTGHQNYQVNYLCKDRGEYIIIIKYGNDDIPGSPFRIEA